MVWYPVYGIARTVCPMEPNPLHGFLGEQGWRRETGDRCDVRALLCCALLCCAWESCHMHLGGYTARKLEYRLSPNKVIEHG